METGSEMARVGEGTGRERAVAAAAVGAMGVAERGEVGKGVVGREVVGEAAWGAVVGGMVRGEVEGLDRGRGAVVWEREGGE